MLTRFDVFSWPAVFVGIQLVVFDMIGKKILILLAEGMNNRLRICNVISS